MKIDYQVKTTVYCNRKEFDEIKNAVTKITGSGYFLNETMREDGEWLNLFISLDKVRDQKKMVELSYALDGVLHFSDVDRIISSNEAEFVVLSHKALSQNDFTEVVNHSIGVIK